VRSSTDLVVHIRLKGGQVTQSLQHGTWWELKKGVPPGELMEGRFTRLFPKAKPAKYSGEALRALAEHMTSPPEAFPTPETETDAEENPGIPAVYTYLGQFIDHDLTFDPTSQLRQRHHHLSKDQLAALVDFRTPRFDLDNVYGRGPADQPYLYQSDGVRMQLGNSMSGNPHDPSSVDVPRGPSGRALIGDPRNDENRIVAQLQATVLRFHNRMVDEMPNTSLEDIRDQVRWHYQWVVVNDFLPTLINTKTIQTIFPHLVDGSSIATHPPQLTIGALEPGLNLMPIEFSVAAYRFGHSMIRPNYRLNETISRRPIFSTANDPAANLGGLRPIPDDWALDWQFFVDLYDGKVPEAPRHNPNDPIKRTPQHSYKIDTSLVNPLAHLPPAVAADPSSLGLRNLERGLAFGLPSGQAVAAQLGIAPLADDEILIGKATAAADDPKKPIAEISPEFKGSTPLWTYVLAEAWATSWGDAAPSKDKDTIAIRLGPVGGRLVGEVFAAFLKGDPSSYLNENPTFEPHPPFTSNGRFGIAQLINATIL
jgi:hypothetical protein